jgi:hypothetical protein
VSAGNHAATLTGDTMQTKTTRTLIARILTARTAGKLSDAVTLCILQDLWAGKTATAKTTLKTLRGL